MQHLGINIIKQASKGQMKELEQELSEVLANAENRSMIICPLCLYESKNKRGSAKVFIDEQGRSFKCFSCGAWRRF